MRSGIFQQLDDVLGAWTPVLSAPKTFDKDLGSQLSQVYDLGARCDSFNKFVIAIELGID